MNQFDISPSRRLSVALAAGLAILASASAFAGAGQVSTVVTPLSPDVTYSIAETPTTPALTTWVGYKVEIANTGGNTINAIRFTGKTLVTDAAEQATYFSFEGNVACDAAGTAIECRIGQLRAGESAPTFVVFFRGPIKVVNQTADDNGQDAVVFSGITYYAEGTGGPNSIPQNSTVAWSSAAVALGTDNPLLVKSSIPKGGATLFTGTGGVSRDGDRFATYVTIPPAATYTTAVIEESTFTTGCVSFLECYQSAITVPGIFAATDPLTILLRQDKANIVPGTKIGSVLITYIDQDNISHPVGPCASGPVPGPDGIPCIAESKYYKNSRVPGWTTELDGDFEWKLINRKNGSYKVF